jgi:activator of 2-hydroxyglutaryl-CoA dehydratase
MINDGKNRADIAAGINRAMSERISKMTKKVGLQREITITGGVAKNSGVVNNLKDVLGVDILKLDGIDPQIVGALGAALFARERRERELKK